MGSGGRERSLGVSPTGLPLAVHNSLSSVLVALTTERDRLRDLHQGSELSRMAVSLRDMVADQREGPRLRTEGPIGKSVPGGGGRGVDRGCP